MRMHPVVVAGIGLVVALLVGSWLYDYLATTVQVDPITIVDKRHKAGYYRQECPPDQSSRQRCRQVWEPPVWLVTYSDVSGRHDVSVTSDAYDRLSPGDRKWISYQRGGFWGARYSEAILSRPPNPERER
jgi:hypothetical protein